MVNLDLTLTIPAPVVNNLTYEEIGRVITAVGHVYEFGYKASNASELNQVERLAYDLILATMDDVDPHETQNIPTLLG